MSPPSAVTNQLDSVSVGRDSASHPRDLQFDDHLQSISLLVSTVGARIDAQDVEGWSVIHWLIFAAMWSGVGKAELSADGQQIDLSNVTRYKVEVEPTLQLLLSLSEKVGYSNLFKREGDIGYNTIEAENGSSSAASSLSRGSLLDLTDRAGNTPLHYCVLHGRVDLVGLLICYGANVTIKNNSGFSVSDLVSLQTQSDIDAKEKKSTQQQQQTNDEAKMTDTIAAAAVAATSTAAKPPSSTQYHELLSSFDTSIYSSSDPTHTVSRHWGTNEGLLFEECRFSGETAREAIARLIFQKKLFDAVDSGDSGDLVEVKKLVRLWRTLQKEGKRMFPLAYRADAFYLSPLQVSTSV